MNSIPMRLFGLAVAAAAFFLTALNWKLLLGGEGFFEELAYLSPFFVVAGLFLAVYPEISHYHDTKRERVIICILTAVGTIAGLANYFLMSRSHAG